MFVITHEKWVVATFFDKQKCLDLWNKIPPELQQELKFEEMDLTYPYYQVWTWKKYPGDGFVRDRSEDCIVTVNESVVNDYIKSLRRDKAWEDTFEDKFDAQYFYLGVISGDGFGYYFENKMGLEREKGLCSLFDHHHMLWYDIQKAKSAGIRFATMYQHELEEYRRKRNIRKKFNRLLRLENSGVLTERGKKKLNKLRDML